MESHLALWSCATVITVKRKLIHSDARSGLRQVSLMSPEKELQRHKMDKIEFVCRCFLNPSIKMPKISADPAFSVLLSAITSHLYPHLSIILHFFSVRIWCVAWKKRWLWVFRKISDWKGNTEDLLIWPSHSWRIKEGFYLHLSYLAFY